MDLSRQTSDLSHAAAASRRLSGGHFALRPLCYLQREMEVRGLRPEIRGLKSDTLSPRSGSIISTAMDLSPRTLRFRLLAAGLLPRTRLARAACYLLGLDLLLFALQRLFAVFRISWGLALRGWVGILSFLAIILLLLLAYRWLKARLLWRLRNRLIVTYMFIGVIPVVLLVAMAFITIYLFAGQFANFVVTSELDSRLRSLQSANAAIANELAARLEHGQPAIAESLEGLKRNDPAWASRQICAWKDGKPIAACTAATPGKTPFTFPSFLSPTFGAIVWDHEELYLRAGTEIGIRTAEAVRGLE